MKTLQRIKNIMRSQKPTELISVGGELMTELQKHLKTLDQRLATVKLAREIAQLDKQGWNRICRQIIEKNSLAKDDAKKKQSLARLGEIAYANTHEAMSHMKSYEGKIEELEEIRKRVIQAIAMIEIENNVRSVTSMSNGSKGLEQQTANLEMETREIRRLLYATDGLMEITS